MIPVLWHMGCNNWDTAFPRFILTNATTCEHFENLDIAPQLHQLHAVICIPGRHSLDDYEKIRRASAHFDKVTFVIYGSEEGDFDSAKLLHPDSKIWYMMPPFHPKQQVDRVAINGWPTLCREMLAEVKQTVMERDIDCSFMGQVTHVRRQECVRASRELKRSFILETEGFTQGLPRTEYYQYLCRSKIALCPSGPRTPDSFRIAEALQAGCIPIADDLVPDPAYPAGYFKYAFGTDSLPFPVVSDWATLPSVVEGVLLGYEHIWFRCAAFWAKYQMDLIERMKEDLSR